MSRRYRRAVTCIARWVRQKLGGWYPDRDIICIANDRAGTRYRHHIVERVAAERCRVAASEDDADPVWWTMDGDDARRRVAAAIAARRDGPAPVFVSLGGDGTHNSVLSAGLGSEALFLRLPLGSGNDGPELTTLESALDVLNGAMVPRWIPALEAHSTSRRLIAFNIASLGLDAYVTILHDRFRSLLPGNTYRLLVDLAVLGYDRALRVGPMGLSGVSVAGAAVSFPREPRSLVAMGVSGRRTYGDHMKVLPDDRNVCIVTQIGVRDKIRMKRLFYEGLHVDEPITTMAELAELTVEYGGRLPMQLDGEATWLEPAEFPVRLKVIPRGVRVLAEARLAAGPAETRRDSLS